VHFVLCAIGTLFSFVGWLLLYIYFCAHSLLLDYLLLVPLLGPHLVGYLFAVIGRLGAQLDLALHIIGDCIGQLD